MKIIHMFLLLLLLIACSPDENKNRKLDASFNKEIGNRIKLLNNDSTQTGPLKVNPNEVDSIVNTLILLSKDIENMNASASRANQYFDTLALHYGLSSFDFIKIKVGMHVDDVATALKENELRFFNMILIKNNKSDALLHTAQ